MEVISLDGSKGSVRGLVFAIGLLGTLLAPQIARAQENWTQHFPAASPSYREAAWMTYDPVRQQVVLFGGCASDGCPSADTWVWDGNNWQKKTPVTSPPARYRHTMYFDPLSQKILMFGGQGSAGTLTDMWLWDGTNWTQIPPPATVPIYASSYASFAYDQLHQQAIYFTGSGQSFASQTWLWDGATWTQLQPATAPPHSGTALLTYDQVRQQLLLATYTDNPLNNNYVSTWTWDGTNWNRKPDIGTLMNYDRNPSEPVYDAVGQQVLVVLQGQATWSWNGTQWTLLHPATNPADRILPAMAFDERNQQVVFFGGSGTGPGALSNETWTFGNALPAVHITVPAGVQFSFNGQTYTGSQTINIAAGSYTLSTTSPQAIAAGTQAVFTSWSDSGALSHTVTVGASGVNITGNFTIQYLLTTSANPSNGGTVTQVSATSSGPYYDAGTLVTVFQSPAAGFTFTNWTGACSGTSACFVTMNAPATVTANFNRPTFLVTINVPAGIQYSLGGFPFTGPGSILLPAGSYFLSLASPQATAAGTQSAFVSWSDGGAQSHNLIVTSSAVTVTGIFKTQYLFTANASPSPGGTVSPPTGYYDAGSALVPTATPNSGFDFEYWSGACTGSNPFCLVILSSPMTVAANFATSLKWVPVFPSASPGPRLNSEMAYDSTRAVTVMFGGDGTQGTTNDTWEWNGTTWTLRSPATSPPARYYGALAYDPIRHQTVLFGGVTAAGARLADTWVWDGTTWTQKGAGPSARSSTRMAFDAPRNQILLFGGANSDTTVIGETWAWNGTSWTQLFPAASPSPRAGQGMVYDEARQQVLLFGGDINGTSTVTNDTWVWNGSWTKPSPVSAPEARAQMAIAFDQAAQQVVLFGGYGGNFSNATWFWDGTNWIKKTYIICPTDRSYPAAAYDAARQQLVLFAGNGAGLLSSNALLNDTWIFSNNLNPSQYPLSISATPAGEGTVAQYAPGQPGPSYYVGSPVLVTATPNAGFELQSWSGACAGAGTCIATMNASQSVTANFGPARTWTEVFPPVSPNPNNGVLGAMAYDKARNQTVLVDEHSSTWTFDGTTWTLRNPPTNLNSNLRQLVYDEANSQIVAVGGSGVFETWVWDGTTWTQKFPAAQPSVRDSFGLAYDGAIGKVVLFGGEGPADLSDTWLWDGSTGTWTQILPAHVPIARAAPSMAYDSVRQVVVLFGGLNVAGAVVSNFNDTWVFNGTDWMQQSPATPPPVRNCAAMAWDDAHQQMVLFGGTPTTLGSGAVVGDTWIWDGMNWAQRTPILSPPGRSCSVMAYDMLHQVPVLFGGFGAGLTTLSDTWIYGGNSASPTFTLTTTAAGSGTVSQSASGQAGPAYLSGTHVGVVATPSAGYEFQYWSGACTGSSPTCTVLMNSNLSVTANFGPPEKWVQLAPASSPLPTPGASAQFTSMAYDQARQQIVFFGGPYNGSAYGNQTWVWDGAAWTQKFPATVPPGRYSPGLAYDSIRQQVVMFGGATQTAILSDTWVWDGTNWTQKAAGLPAPPGRINHGMAFDGQQIVMFGGWDAAFAGFVVYGDTWVWNGTSWTQKILATHPTARSDFGMAYDGARNQVVVFSGVDAGANDTWLWNGSTSTWTQAHPALSPPSGWNAMAWDSARQQMIDVIQSYTLSAPTQTWSWDGANWTQKLLAVEPSTRYAAAMAFDTARQQMILFSGQNAALLGDTWALLAPSVNLVTQAPVLSKNPNGYDVVTVSLKNQGNVPLTSISLTSSKVGTVTGIPITSTTLPSISPGATASFTVEVPTASLPGTTASLAFQGLYSTATVSNAAWTISIRSVNLP